MFNEGDVIYFDPFYFKNGNTAKPKYFIVLKVNAGRSLLASLPTRKSTIPEDQHITAGCLELPDINLNCFIFKEDEPVTNCGKCFDFRTYIYGHQIEDYDIQLLSEIYPNLGSDYIVWGQLKTKFFTAIVQCFKSSNAVKRKYKRLL